jgi:hypothetical protein
MPCSYLIQPYDDFPLTALLESQVRLFMQLQLFVLIATVLYILPCYSETVAGVWIGNWIY